MIHESTRARRGLPPIKKRNFFERKAHQFLDFLEEGGCALIGCSLQIILGLVVVAFWAAVILIAWHFISKYW